MCVFGYDIFKPSFHCFIYKSFLFKNLSISYAYLDSLRNVFPLPNCYDHHDNYSTVAHSNFYLSQLIQAINLWCGSEIKKINSQDSNSTSLELKEA